MNIGIMIARQRTGTHVVGQILTQTGAGRYLGEIFLMQSTRGFYRFLMEQLEATGDQSVWLPQNRVEMFRKYCSNQATGPGEGFPIVDVKYNRLHSLDGLGRDPRCPEMIRLIRGEGIPVLHLVRRNYLKRYVSLLKLRANRQPHARDGTKPIKTMVLVNPQKALSQIQQDEELERVVDGYLDGYENCLKLDYDDIFPKDDKGDRALSRSVARSLCWFFAGQPIEIGKLTLMAKVTSDNLAHVVENYEELRAEFVKAGAASFLEN